MAEDIMNILFQKGFYFFSGIKTDILEYEFSTIYHNKGNTIGLIIDHDLYHIRVNLIPERASPYTAIRKENRYFSDRSELIQYLNDI
jgi:hypothetical protein